VRTLVVTFFTLVSISGFTRPTSADAQEFSRFGEVHFSTTCDESVGADFDRAVALLHSFEFALARLEFEAVGQADPGCAMAHWGVAMTYYHLLWAPPTASDLVAGHTAAAAAQQVPTSDREAAYIEAISTFYRNYETLEHRTRAIAYEKAMESVQAGSPHDPEAAIFHRLAVLSNADPTDKTYAVQHETGPFFEAMFEKMPEHPGLAHYIIHSYDYPPLSSKAVSAAHRYLEIAPDLTHSVHMSGHIFTQEGMWDASIDANVLSVATARAVGAQPELRIQTQPEEMHSLDYLAYAYLQRGQNSAASAGSGRRRLPSPKPPEIGWLEPATRHVLPLLCGIGPAHWERHAEDIRRRPARTWSVSNNLLPVFTIIRISGCEIRPRY